MPFLYILRSVVPGIVLEFVGKPIIVMIPKPVFIVVIVMIKLMMTENPSFTISKYPRVCD